MVTEFKKMRVMAFMLRHRNNRSSHFIHRIRVPQRITVVITAIYRQNAGFWRNIVRIVNE